MPVSEKSISAITNPESIAKSIATRKRQMEDRKALKQKIVYEKLEQSAEGMLGDVRKQLVENANHNTKLSNLEYNSKTQEAKIDNLKTQVDINTANISNLSKVNTSILQNSSLGNMNNNQQKFEDTECRSAIKELKKKIKESTIGTQNVVDTLDEKIELNDTQIADISTQLATLNRNSNKINAEINSKFNELTDKLNTLFRILYQSSKPSDYLNSLCPWYNTEIVSPAPPVNSNFVPRHVR